MRILYLVSNPQLNPQLNTGYGRHIRETVHGLESRGHEVKVVLAGNFGEPQSLAEKTNKDGFIFRLKSMLPSLVWETFKDVIQIRSNRYYIKRVEEALLSYNPDMVYERASYLSNPIKLKPRYNIPWLVEVNSPFVSQRIELSGPSLLATLAERIERDRFQYADHVFCVSAALGQFIQIKYSLHESKITVNHNGVDPLEFQQSQNFSSKCPFTIGFVGSIMPYHGLDKLILAYAEFYSDYPDSRLLIVGDGQSLPELKAMAKVLGIENAVEFTGSVPYYEVKVQIDHMDVCVLPATKWYCSPVKMFEYAIMAKPIIAERIAPVIELIDNGKEGLLVGDEKELTNAMIFFKNHPAEGKMMADRFKLKVQLNYTWQCNVSRIEKIILKLRAT